jgi:ketosteroid isomerase-like protein
MTKFHLTANDDVRATYKGDIAWTTFTWHLSAQLNNGTPIEADGRQTDIWEKRDGKWLIVHEHISSPANL